MRRERLRRGRDWRSTSSETSRWRLKQPPSGPPLTNPSLTLVRKSLQLRRSMLAGQQITALTKINARSSEFEPKYLRTSIALWVDGGSQETQYSVLSTRYSVHSVFSSWYSVLNTQEHCLAAVVCVVACCCCCCLFDHLWGFHFTSIIGSSWAQHRGSHHANRANEVDNRNIMRQVNLHPAAHRERTAKPGRSQLVLDSGVGCGSRP